MTRWRRFKCWLELHVWGPWSNPVPATAVYLWGTERRTRAVVRYCKHCGIRQVEEDLL